MPNRKIHLDDLQTQTPFNFETTALYRGQVDISHLPVFCVYYYCVLRAAFVFNTVTMKNPLMQNTLQSVKIMRAHTTSN